MQNLRYRNAELCIESSSTTPTHTGLNDVPRALSPPLPSIDWYPRQVPPRVVAQHGHSGMHTLTLTCSTFLFLCGILPRTVGGAGSCGATFGWGENVDRRRRRHARLPHHRCWRGAWLDGHAALRRGRRRNIIPVRAWLRCSRGCKWIGAEHPNAHPGPGVRSEKRWRGGQGR